MTDPEQLIGDYRLFFSDLLSRMKKADISITGIPLSHILYRTATQPEYEKLRDEIKRLCSEFVETQFKSRAVSILILKNPLVLEDGHTVSIIELPAPKISHTYPSGLESIGVVLGNKLPSFIEQHKTALTGVKEHSKQHQLAYITFENEKTVKFYDISLKEIILLQGWTIDRVN